MVFMFEDFHFNIWTLTLRAFFNCLWFFFAAIKYINRFQFFFFFAFVCSFSFQLVGWLSLCAQIVVVLSCLFLWLFSGTSIFIVSGIFIGFWFNVCQNISRSSHFHTHRQHFQGQNVTGYSTNFVGLWPVAGRWSRCHVMGGHGSHGTTFA